MKNLEPAGNLSLVLPDAAQRKKTLHHFNDLLASPTRESDWQSFFDTNPYVLTESLCLRPQGFFSHVPLVSGIPDYVFYRGGKDHTGDYGIIELKRPDHNIIGQYSYKIIFPSRELRIAQQEAAVHLEAIKRSQFISDDFYFVAGNRRHAFIIMGRSSELVSKCKNDCFSLQFRTFLPDGFHLYTYDEVFDMFASEVPPTVQVLVPVIPGLINHIEEFLTVSNPNAGLGLHLRPAALIVVAANKHVSSCVFQCRGSEADAKSIISLVMLSLSNGERVKVVVDGPDAHALFSEIRSVFESGFAAAYKR